MLALTEGLARLKTFHKTFDDDSDDDDEVTTKMMIIFRFKEICLMPSMMANDDR